MKTNERAKKLVRDLLVNYYKIDDNLYQAIKPYLNNEEISIKLMQHCVAADFLLDDIKDATDIVEQAVALLIANPKTELISLNL